MLKRFPIVAYMLLYALCFGQEFRATVTGRVTDSSGAAVPNATIHITNVATNEAGSAVSDHQGSYTIPLLRPGTYVLTAEVSGFKKFTREDLILNVGQTAAVNIALEVGALSEQVTVSGEAPLLDTQKADGGTVIGNKGIVELPLNARNPIMLSRLVSGVSNVGLIVFQEPFSHGAIDSWSINGSQDHGNEFLLDGAPDTGQAGDNVVAYIPPVDSVQEFKIQTNLYDAQYGRTGGGIVNMSLKSGTNSLHGTGYEFLRRNALDANSFQNKAYGEPKGGHLQDQYGFELEGPIYLPRLSGSSLAHCRFCGMGNKPTKSPRRTGVESQAQPQLPPPAPASPAAVATTTASGERSLTPRPWAHDDQALQVLGRAVLYCTSCPRISPGIPQHRHACHTPDLRQAILMGLICERHRDV